MPPQAVIDAESSHSEKVTVWQLLRDFINVESSPAIPEDGSRVACLLIVDVLSEEIPSSSGR
jgi:hypothetical protein